MSNCSSSGQAAGIPAVSGRLQAESSSLHAPVQKVQQVLRASAHLPLRSIECAMYEGVVILRGRVPTFYCKQLAQSLAQAIPGVELVDNRIEVTGPGARTAR